MGKAMQVVARRLHWTDVPISILYAVRGGLQAVEMSARYFQGVLIGHQVSVDIERDEKAAMERFKLEASLGIDQIAGG